MFISYSNHCEYNNAVYNQYIFVKADCLKLLQFGSFLTIPLFHKFYHVWHGLPFCTTAPQGVRKAQENTPIHRHSWSLPSLSSLIPQWLSGLNLKGPISSLVVDSSTLSAIFNINFINFLTRCVIITMNLKLSWCLLDTTLTGYDYSYLMKHT